MNVAISTGNLTANFEKGYWNLFNYAVENDYYIHSDMKYLNVEQYFNKAYLNRLKVKKVIFKIEINKNPIKKIINIPKQIDLICKKFKIECIDTIQICNNPSANSLNMFLIS